MGVWQELKEMGLHPWNIDLVIIELLLVHHFQHTDPAAKKKILIEIHQPRFISLKVSPIQSFIWANYQNS